MTRFRQALLEELLVRVDERPVMEPARAPRTVRPKLAFGAALGMASVIGVASALATTATDSGNPAYAVTSHNDGTVTVTVNWLGDPADANRALADAGVRAKVILPTTSDNCPGAEEFRSGPHGPQNVNASSMADVFGNQVTIRPDLIPADTVFVLSAAQIPDESNLMVFVDVYPDPGPACLIKPDVHRISDLKDLMNATATSQP